MTRQRYLVTCALAFAVAGLPVVAVAQDRTSNGNTTGSAVPRGGDGGGSATPRGGDGGGSGGSSAGSGSSGGGYAGGAGSSSGSVAPPSPVFSSIDAPRRSDDQGSRSRGGGASTGSATPRSSSGGSGGSTRGDGASASGRSASSGSNESGAPRRAVPAYSRPRDGRPVTGEVAERGSVPGGGGGGFPSYPYYPYYPYYPWGFWGPGYGFGLGSLYYDPWFSGYGYGDPGYGGFFGGGGGGGGGGGYSVSESRRENGSLRLKISPKEAQIFVDGYYVGVVDSFDGSFQKLGIEGGSHKIEVKADGYEPAVFDVLITPGETVTYKGELKRIK